MEQIYLLKDADLDQLLKRAVFQAIGELRETDLPKPKPEPEKCTRPQRPAKYFVVASRHYTAGKRRGLSRLSVLASISAIRSLILKNSSKQKNNL